MMSNVALVLLLTMVVITGVLSQYFTNLQREQLKSQLNLATLATEQIGQIYLESIGRGQYRLTLVDPDGTVRFDTHVLANELENHAEREEIKEANEVGAGSSVRKSATMTEQTIYEAKKMVNGQVLRISISQATSIGLMMGMIQAVGLIGVLATVLSSFLARRVAINVVEPLNAIDLDKPMNNQTYDELSPLLHRLNTQHQEINYQINVLKQKREEFNQITQNMNEILVLLDESERIVSMNPAARMYFEIIESSEGLDFINVERGSEWRNALDQVVAEGKTSFMLTHNHQDYQFDLSRIDSDEGVQGVVILGHDISDRVQAERNRREFTANVSHELKTPLQSIIGSAELIENGIVKKEDMPRFIGHIRNEADRLVHLIDSIIQLSKIDEDIPMEMEVINLMSVASNVYEKISETAKQKGISLHLTGDCGQMTGVPHLLFEIIYNLCDNAIKYSPENSEVNIKITEESNMVQLTVQDFGIGIRKEHLNKIFERFYRVDKSHSKQSGGTGLGLAIVKRSVQYLGGKIEVESEENVGTMFKIIFPKI